MTLSLPLHVTADEVEIEKPELKLKVLAKMQEVLNIECFKPDCIFCFFAFSYYFTMIRLINHTSVSVLQSFPTEGGHGWWSEPSLLISELQVALHPKPRRGRHFSSWYLPAPSLSPFPAPLFPLTSRLPSE